MRISTLVGLKNNLEYSKKFYERFRKIYPTEELCFASYGSTDGTNEWLDSLNDENLKYFFSEEKKTFSDTFNKCAEIATKEYIVFCHNDIVMLEGWLENIDKHLEKGVAVTYTTIEPPIFSGHERPGKIVKDFGLEFDDVKYEELESFAKKVQSEKKDMTVSGSTFFIAQNRNVYLAIGGMDNLYSPMFCEDDDILFRLHLLGIKPVVSLDSMVYHFVSKTSRFSEEHINNSRDIEYKSNLNRIRKWGIGVNVKNKRSYDVGFILNNCFEEALKTLEPFATTLYVDCDFINYINSEQPNTKINLSKKIKPINSVRENDIMVSIKDCSKLTDNDIKILTAFPDFIKDSNAKVGSSFEIGNLIFTIKALNTYEHKLVSVNSDYYKDKCI